MCGIFSTVHHLISIKCPFPPNNNFFSDLTRPCCDFGSRLCKSSLTSQQLTQRLFQKRLRFSTKCPFSIPPQLQGCAESSARLSNSCSCVFTAFKVHRGIDSVHLFFLNHDIFPDALVSLWPHILTSERLCAGESAWLADCSVARHSKKVTRWAFCTVNSHQDCRVLSLSLWKMAWWLCYSPFLIHLPCCFAFLIIQHVIDSPERRILSRVSCSQRLN